MRKPFHEILHPSEVRGPQQKRYWIAVVGWFVLAVLGLLLFVGLEALLMLLYERQFGAAALNADGTDIWILGGFIVSVVLGIFLGDYLWGLLFVGTGYLSREAVIRIRTNRAPTTRGERIHRRMSLTLSALIPAALVWVGWYLDAWWVMGLAILLGGWLSLSIWAAWKSAHAMVAGNLELPADLEERVMHNLDKPTKGQGEQSATGTSIKPDSDERNVENE